MIFSCDYTAEDVEQRPYLLATHYLALFDEQDQPLSRIWSFDTDTMLGTRKDGSTVKVHSCRWYIPYWDAALKNGAEKNYQTVLRVLPPEFHAWVEPLLEEPKGILLEHGQPSSQH